MIDGGQFVTFFVASMAIIMVPGPSVLFTLARGVAWGRTVAVLTVLGNSLGTLVLSVIVAVGLGRTDDRHRFRHRHHLERNRHVRRRQGDPQGLWIIQHSIHHCRFL